MTCCLWACAGNLSYTMGPAAKLSKANPCCNVPMECPLCPKKPMPTVHWRSNMMAHWNVAHSGVTMPPCTKLKLSVPVEEREWTEIVGRQRKQVPK